MRHVHHPGGQPAGWPFPGTHLHRWGGAEGLPPHSEHEGQEGARQRLAVHSERVHVPALLRGPAPLQPPPPPGRLAVGGTGCTGGGARSGRPRTSRWRVQRGLSLIGGTDTAALSWAARGWPVGVGGWAAEAVGASAGVCRWTAAQARVSKRSWDTSSAVNSGGVGRGGPAPACTAAGCPGP